MTALCVGAAMPDVVDGLIGIVRGHGGQGVGHSLLGMAVFGLPLGLLLNPCVRRAVRTLRPLKSDAFWAFAWNLGVAALVREAASNAEPRNRRFFLVSSLAQGAFMHLLFDLVSHGHFPWLIPWVPKIAIFPDWWYATWLRVWLPWKPAGRKIGPHATLWIVLSVWGMWSLLSPAFRAWQDRKKGDVEAAS